MPNHWILSKRSNLSIILSPTMKQKRSSLKAIYLRKIFQVRDCRKTSPGKGINTPCLNYHIKLCPAPCIKNISPELYRKNIDFVILFLKGKDRTIIEKLKIKMDNYSKIKEFEKEAEFKNKIDDIK